MDPHQRQPCVIVNGGNIYDRGKPTAFDDFLNQMDGDVSMICETACRIRR